MGSDMVEGSMLISGVPSGPPTVPKGRVDCLDIFSGELDRWVGEGAGLFKETFSGDRGRLKIRLGGVEGVKGLSGRKSGVL